MSGALHPPGSPPPTGSAGSTSSTSSPGPAPLLTPVQAAALLDQVIYEQVLECVDLEALYHVAQQLDTMIGEIDGIPSHRIGELARSMIDRALLRMPDDLRGYLRISELVDRENCVLCQDEARQAACGRTAGVTATGGDRRSKRPHS